MGNSFRPFSQTTTAVIGGAVSIVSGSAVGVTQGSHATAGATTAGSGKLSESERNSLLVFLHQLDEVFKAKPDIPSLNLFDPVLLGSGQSIAGLVAPVSTAPVSAIAHASQSVVDLSVSVSALIQSVQNPQHFTHAEAFTVASDNENRGLSAHCQALSGNLLKVVEVLGEQIDKAFGPGQYDASHASLAKASATIPFIGSASVVGIISSGIDVVGSVFRQLSVISHFSKLESASQGEKNIYDAFGECCQLSGKDSVASFAALRKLEAALSNFDIASKFGVESSAPVSSVLIRLLVSAPFLIALRSLIAISQSSKGLIYSIENPQELSHAEASTLDLQEVHNGFSANIDFLEGNLTKIAKKLCEDIDRGFGREGLDPSNASTALSTAAVPFMGAATSATVVSLGLDSIGSVLREISASIHFVQTESKNADDNEGVKNIYLALKKCGDVISGSGNNQQSLEALNELEAVLSNFEDGQQMSRNHSVSSPVVSMAARLLASTPVLTALRALIAVSQASKGLIGSIPDSRVFLHPGASIIQLDKKDSFSANCSALEGHLKEVAAQLHHNIEMGFGDGDINRSNASAAKSTAAVPFMGAATSAAVVSAGLDSIGSVLREISGLKTFCNNDLQSAEEVNIYFALSECSAVIRQSKNSLESFKALKALEEALSDFQVAQKLGVEHSVSGPSISVATRLLTSSVFVEALKAVNSAGIAVTAVAHAFSNEKENFTKSFKASFTKASSIHALGSEGGSMHSKNVSELVKNFDILMQEIDKDLEIIQNPSERNVIADSAKGSARILSGLSMVPSLLTAAVGVLSRELSGVIDFSVNDKGTREESARVRKTDKEQTGADLDALLSRALEMKDRIIRAQELGLCTPIASGATHVVTSGALIASLNSVAGICFALSALRNFSDPDQVPTKLKLEEIEKAEKYKNKMVKSNQQSAAKSGTGSSSAHLSLHEKLQSVWEKVVLSDRSILAIAPPGGIAVDRQDVNRTGQSLIAASQGNSTGFLSGALGILALTAMQSGISTESFCQILTIGQKGCDRLADGPDQIQLPFFKSNFSSISNTTRLSAEVMHESSLSQSSLRSTHAIGEMVLSRSLSVAITHSKALSAMLGNLIAEERKVLQRDENYSDCALISARIMDKFAENILAKLNDAQKGRGMIDGLNEDMASQIASASKASIVTALSVHAIVIASFLQAHAVTRKASVIQEAQTNEGLVVDDRGAVDSLMSKSVSRTVSQGLNIIRAFTQNCNKALEHNVEALKKKVYNDENSLIHMQESLNLSTATAMISTVCISSVVEEMIEIGISRSLGLLDQAQVKNSATQSSGVSQGELKKVQEDVADDSALGNLGSMTYSISALRLIVSHLGESLAELGSQLEEKQRGLLQENLAMHSSQRDMMHHLSQSLTHCGAGLSQVAGVLSRLPILSEGVVDQLRMVVEGLNRQIRFEQSNSEVADSSKHTCKESVLTGVTLDVGTDGVMALVKSLVKASLLGLETATAIAKFLEIIALHQRPDEALILETRAGLSQPNGLLRNIDSKLIGASVGVSALMHSFSGETKSEESLDLSNMTEDSIRSLQGEIDSRIDRCQMLGDEEEQEEKDSSNKKIGLKEFYMDLAEILNELPADDANLKNLISRFDRGGIDLSSYHSDVGGLKGKAFVQRCNPLIQNGAFKGCNDASQLLDMFIAKAIDSELDKLRGKNKGLLTLCEKLKNKLSNTTRSKKVEDTFTLIVDRVGNALFEKSKNPIRAPHAGKMFSRPPIGLAPKDIRADFKTMMNTRAPPPPVLHF